MSANDVEELENSVQTLYDESDNLDSTHPDHAAVTESRINAEMEELFDFDAVALNQETSTIRLEVQSFDPFSVETRLPAVSNNDFSLFF